MSKNDLPGVLTNPVNPRNDVCLRHSGDISLSCLQYVNETAGQRTIKWPFSDKAMRIVC